MVKRAQARCALGLVRSRRAWDVVWKPSLETVGYIRIWGRSNSATNPNMVAIPCTPCSARLFDQSTPKQYFVGSSTHRILLYYGHNISQTILKTSFPSRNTALSTVPTLASVQYSTESVMDVHVTCRFNITETDVRVGWNITDHHHAANYLKDTR